MTTASALSRLLGKLRRIGGIGPDAAASTPADPSGTRPVLDVRGLTKSFRGPDGRPFKALDDASLTIDAPGALVALTGPDGAGKTTFIRILSGLLAPDRGDKDSEARLLVLGLRPDPSDGAFTSSIGVMPQKFGLYEDLSARENLECFAALKGVPRPVFEERFADLMELTGLARVDGIENRPAGAYSGGMKQKLALSCALLSEPPLLLLDEPTVGVDPLSRRELMRIVETMRRRSGTTVVFSTAYLEEAEAADRVVVFANGRILADDRPEALTARAAGRTWAAHPEAGATLSGLSRALMARAQDPGGVLLDAVPRGGAVALTTREGVTEAMLREALSRFDLPPHSLEARPARLEDAYADLTFERSPSERGAASGKGALLEDPVVLPVPADRPEPQADVPVVEARGLERLTPRQNLRYFARCCGVSADAADRALEGSRLGIFGERAAFELPPGAKRELAMAAALLHRPSVLFLDEATSGADVAARRAFWRRIADLAAGGTTVVVTTHFMEEAEYCDRFLIQDAGRVLVLGTPDEVRAAAFGPEGGRGRSIEEAFVEIVTKSREAAK